MCHREGSENPSEIRARPPPPGGSGVVAHARGSDPYTTLLAAANFLAEQTGKYGMGFRGLREPGSQCCLGVLHVLYQLQPQRGASPRRCTASCHLGCVEGYVLRPLPSGF